MQYKIHYQVWGKKHQPRVPSGRPQEHGDMPKMRKSEPIYKTQGSKPNWALCWTHSDFGSVVVAPPHVHMQSYTSSHVNKTAHLKHAP